MGRIILKILTYTSILGSVLFIVLIIGGEYTSSLLINNFGIPFSFGQRFFLLFSIILISGACSVTAYFFKRSLRHKEMRDLAHKFNWNYTQKTELPFLTEFANYLNINSAHPLRGTSENVITGQIYGRNFVISDQSYTVRAGKSSSTYTQTLVGIEITNAQLPLFCLRPEDSKGLLDTILNSPTEHDRDIDFTNYPVFSQKYLLYGTNANAIRHIFSHKVVSFYEQNPLFTTIGGGKYLVIYNPEVEVPQKDIPAKLNFIANLANTFVSS